MAEEALAGGRPSPYEAQIHALLQAETDIAESTESIPRSSLFARSPQQDGSAPSPLDDQARLARALEESTRDAAAAATQNRVADDEERLRLALALSTAAAAPPPPAAAPTDEQRLAAAMAASEQSFEAQRSSMLDTVLGVLRACSPIIASYIDEHCGLFVESGGGASTAAGAAEIEVFCDFRRTVDTLLADLLSEVGIGLGDVAQTLQQAREHTNSPAGGGSLVSQGLLAVESFASFRRLMTERNEAIHREARAALPGGSAAHAAAGGDGRAAPADPHATQRHALLQAEVDIAERAESFPRAKDKQITMLGRLARSALPAAKRCVTAQPAVTVLSRSFGVAGIPYWAGPDESIPLMPDLPPVLPADFPEGAVIPMLVDTLEWVLDSPPNVHQFEEPPIIVEIEHLKNLIHPDD